MVGPEHPTFRLRSGDLTTSLPLPSNYFQNIEKKTLFLRDDFLKFVLEISMTTELLQYDISLGPIGFLVVLDSSHVPKNDIP